MRVSKEELVAVLAQFNPWWRGEPISDLPSFRRAAFRELHEWMAAPPAPRAVLLSGARQIGKTTLLLQAARQVRQDDVASVRSRGPLIRGDARPGASIDTASRILVFPAPLSPVSRMKA